MKVKVLMTLAAAVAVAGGVAACGSGGERHAQAGMMPTAQLPPRTPNEPAEATAAKVEAAIAKALPGEHWEQNPGNTAGAYRQDELMRPDGTSFVVVEYFHTQDAAIESIPQMNSLNYWMAQYPNQNIVTIVANAASNAEVQAVQGNH